MPNIVLEFQNGAILENAGSKAPADVSSILADNGYQRYFVITSGGNLMAQFRSLLISSIKLVASAKSGSTLLCQYPIYSKKGYSAFRIVRRFLKMKRVRLVGLLHDLLFVARSGEGKEQEIRELNKYDTLIVHSPRMATLLKDAGCTKPCVVLGLFDYLVTKENQIPRTLSHTIAFAGNLSKIGFIGNLETVTRGNQTRFVLYGRNDSHRTFGDGITPGGLFLPDDVSSIKGSWGLVWDGPSIDKLTGEAGSYQKINSPHKASLYLVAGLPLIVSSEAAIAEIVTREHLGITVDSLLDVEKRISQMTEEDYARLIVNVKTYGEKLKSGHNLLRSLAQIA